MTARSFRMILSLLTMFACAFAARSASAQTCTNDDDCANAACGGDVCDWEVTPHTCKPAGTAAKGQDGWCTGTDNCKCKALGATCVVANCSFTRACEADGGTCAAGGSGGGGSTGTGTAGTSGGGGGGGGGCSVAGDGAGSWSLLLAAFGLLALRARRQRLIASATRS
jgi:MYXO-CTERM domain-containing protein